MTQSQASRGVAQQQLGGNCLKALRQYLLFATSHAGPGAGSEAAAEGGESSIAAALEAGGAGAGPHAQLPEPKQARTHQEASVSATQVEGGTDVV